MIALEAHPEGTILPVRAQPGARRNCFAGVHNGKLKVAVTQVAEKGKANRAIIDVLAKELRLRKSQVELIAGETAAQKRFLIRAVSREQLAERIAAALEST